MNIKMLVTSASPEMILDAGKCYKVPDRLGKRLLQKVDCPIGNGESMEAGPFAIPAPAGEKIHRVPPQPDPDDRPDIPDEPEMTEDFADDE